MAKLNYNIDLFKNTMRYDSESPTGLISIKTGNSLGSFEYDKFGASKAIRVSVNGQRYLVHRIIWVLEKGYCPIDLEIDHIDGNPFNNRIENLRLATSKQNQRNRSKNINNKTGVHGVGIHTTSNNSGGYNTYIRATWVDKNGKAVHKDFNVKKFNSTEEAIEFVDLYRQMILPDADTYSEGHGNRESKRKDNK
jgi:hypothetical protein